MEHSQKQNVKEAHFQYIMHIIQAPLPLEVKQVRVCLGMERAHC